MNTAQPYVSSLEKMTRPVFAVAPILAQRSSSAKLAELAQRRLRASIVTGITPSIRFIAERVAKFYDIEEQQMHTRTRGCVRIAFPRQVTMHLAARLTVCSHETIGGYFDRSHSSVDHSVATVLDLMSVSADLSREINGLELSIRSEMSIS